MSGKQNYARMSNDERCALVESICIKYPRLKALLAQIEHCRMYSKLAAEPECMFIGGWQGAGKTTLQDCYAEDFPRIVPDEGPATIPVLCGRVPNRASDKTLVSELLRVMGDPAHDKGTSYNQTTRLRGLIRECKVEIILLDEFQHFVDKDSKKILKTVSDWLKNLIDQTRVPVVLIGMPYADVILDALGNEQLQRRFSVRSSLDSFSWTDDASRNEFRGFLKMIDDQLPFSKPSRLAEKTLAFRFFCGTNGRVGKIMKIMRRAAEHAITRGLPALDLEVLAEAYDERLQRDQPGHENPFVDRAKLKIVPFDEVVPSFEATGNRSKAKLVRERSAAVLSQR